MTDPTYNLIKLSSKGKEVQRHNLRFSTNKILPTADYQENKKNYIDDSLLNQINELSLPSKDQSFINASKKIHQFSELKSNKFKSADAVKMANLDSLTGITHHIHGALIPQTSDSTLIGISENETKSILINPTYCDIYGSPGGFTEYLQWRMEKLYGYGFAPRYQDWNLNLIKEKAPDNQGFFERIYGEDSQGTGDLVTEGHLFVERVQKREVLGVDFVIANGNLPERDTALEFLYALFLVKSQGNILIRLTNSWSKLIVDVIYIYALVFDSIEIIKPVTSDPGSNERYLWCQSRRDEIEEFSDIIFLATEESTEGLFEDLPSDFENWLINANNFLAREQIGFLQKVISAMNGEIVDIEWLNLDQALIIWGI